MSVDGEKRRKAEKIGKYMREILSDREIDCDDTWWEEKKARECLECLAAPEDFFLCTSDDMGLEINEKLVIMSLQNAEAVSGLLKQVRDTVSALGQNSKMVRLHLVCFARNMKGKITLEKTFDQEEKKRLKKEAEGTEDKKKGGRNLSVSCTCILDQDYRDQEIRLKNLRRYEMSLMPPVEGKMNLESDGGNDRQYAGSRFQGICFNIDLYQMVELYNQVGDRLFKKNVRYGISDTMDVDASIRNTLKNEPELFWFKNNGIAILVENPDFRLGCGEEMILGTLRPGCSPGFSVINGAQTITAAAGYYYELEYKKEQENKDSEAYRELTARMDNFKKAQISVRLIHILTDGLEMEEKESCLRSGREISVSLNRQKPIRMEDIAFTSPFIEKLAGYLERAHTAGYEKFYLVKRGEGSGIGDCLELVDVVRARAACIGRPGNARSDGTKKLLEFEAGGTGEYSFKDKELFPDEWLETDEEQKTFQKHFGAVWFARTLAGEYEKWRKTVGPEEENYMTAVNNGKWYFTSAVVWLLNGQSKGEKGMPDFTDFPDCFGRIREGIPYAASLFAAMVSRLAQKGGTKLNSNTFKNNELYNRLLETEDFTEIGNLFNQYLSDGEKIIVKKPQQTAPPEPAAKKRKSPVFDKKVTVIVLGNTEESVVNTAQAMVKTTQYILEKWKPDLKKMEETCSLWVTGYREKVDFTQGYFRGKEKTALVDNQTYWVGTSSNSATKYQQIRQLCGLAQIPKNEISWYREDRTEEGKKRHLLFQW
ncbi:MAG TPA: AIPR family protein [Candidatus Hungatella pullicola]|nr:AIPR family protein [Candidatus Hungatella pullicola]